MSIIGSSDLALGFLGAAPGTTSYSISRSLRFNSSDSAYCSKNYSTSPSNNTKITISLWCKRSKLDSGSTFYTLLWGYNGSSAYESMLVFQSDQIYIRTTGGASPYDLRTSAVYRDTSAWYHIVLAIDTTQATAANRAKLFVNGVQVTSFVTANYPVQNSSTQFLYPSANNAIGGTVGFASYFDGYIADVYALDGIAVADATSFGEFDATTGVWNPKAYRGSYGTNGFHLPFSDNSAATATTLGKDTSGNGNNWTPNNLSVTAGAGNDSLVDSPTNGIASSGGDAGGVVVGNYATLNPLETLWTRATLSNGNLEASSNWAASTIRFPASGKYYAEFTLSSFSASENWIGASTGTGNYLVYTRLGRIETTGGSTVTTVSTYTIGDVIGVAVNIDSLTVAFYKNGTQVYSGTYDATGRMLAVYADGATWVANFGQRPFAMSGGAPAGYKSLNTANLPTPMILKGSSYFDVKTYTGNGGTQNISGLGFSPDLVWIKNRAAAVSHYLQDVVRGTYAYMSSNSTGSENTSSGADWFSTFDSTGFTVKYGSTGFGNSAGWNENGTAYAAWCWDGGSSTVTNTQGSITSTVRANASAGFSIVGWVNDGSASIKTCGHGLGVTPSLVIVRNRSTTDNWLVISPTLFSTPARDYMFLNLTDAKASVGSDYWSFSSTTFGVQQSARGSNGNNMIAYCFAPVSGYSSMGSYTGNGSTDGPFVYTGFRPRWVLIKRSDVSGDNWFLFDTSRDTYNVGYLFLLASASTAENTTAYTAIDILSNGFKLRSGNLGWNASGGTYCFACFAENPFSIARAR